MRLLSSFRSRTKPCKVILDNKPIRNNNANRLELVFLKKNCKNSWAYAISNSNKAFANSGTKLHRVSKTSNIIQKKLKIELYIFSAWPKSLVVRVLINAIRSKAKALLWVECWQKFRRFWSHSFQYPSY